MRKIMFIVIGVFLAFFITGCSNDVDLVKDGVMNFNKTITVGEAFDNWNDCEDSRWDSFETDNHTKVVEFTCKKKNVQKYMSKLKSFLSKKDQEEASYLDIKSNKQIFQWTINKDDTFQIDNVQVETVWADGKKFSDSQKPMKQLRNVYDNEIAFNLSELNKMVAEQFAYVFQMIKVRAK